jgi:purine-binding chemotaxis protein CheW
MDEKKSESPEQTGDKRYLFVMVDKTDYGIDLEIVQEIIVMQEISPIPSTKPFCRGVINIRGTIVPVIDLRIKMGLDPCDYDENACIVIVAFGGEKIGMIVEAVQDVLMIQPSQLQKSPARSSEDGRRSISSQIANIDGAVKQILNVNRVFDIEPNQETAV